MSEDDYITEEPEVPASPVVKAKGKPRAALPDPAERHVPKPGKKDNRSNPRDGKVTKAEGKAAKHVPGADAMPPKVFDAKEVCDELKLWWENDGGDSFIVQRGPELWSKWPVKAIKDLARKLPGRLISLNVRKDTEERISEMDETLLHARSERCVDQMLPGLAGYRAGVHDLRGGRRVIVRSSPQIIPAVEGDWTLVKALIEGRFQLNEGIDQCDYFYSWCKVGYESLVTGSPGNYTPGHILVLAGPVGSGKSRLATNIITPLFGGREADPTPFLTGEDIFNSDLMEAEHWASDELKGASQKTVDRVKLSEGMKAIVVEEKKRMRLMRTNPVTVYPFIRMSLTMNDAVEKMRAFPMLTNDFRDKVLMLKIAQRGLPMPTDSPAEKKAFNDAVAAQMPAFCWWLMNEYQIPEALKLDAMKVRQTRFGFSGWQHPELAEQLFDDTPHAQLLRLIDDAELTHSVNGSRKLWELWHPLNLAGRKLRGGEWEREANVWQGTAEDLEKLLCGEMDGVSSSVAKAAIKLCKFGEMAHRLSSLREDRPDRVDNHRTNSARHWRIGSPPTAVL